MKTGLTFLLCAVLTLTACAAQAPTYHRLDTSGRIAEADILSCDSQAQQLYPHTMPRQEPPDFRGIYRRNNTDEEILLWQSRQRAFDDCMQEKGWLKD